MTVHPSKLAPSVRQQYGLTAAECVIDPELHTGPAGYFERPEEKAARIDVAAEVCWSCPVIARCLDLAINADPEPGIWASLDVEPLTQLFNDLADADLGQVA